MTTFAQRLTGIALVASLALLVAVAPNLPVAAHGDKIKVAEGARGPVKLSAEQLAALDLELARADLRPLDVLLELHGELATLPDRQADVTVRVSGRVKQLQARLGESVRAGQQLAVIESRTVGNPPPSVVVTAPMSGVIDRRAVILGQAVDPGTALFHISDRAEMLVLARVYEEDLGKVAVGQAARVRALGDAAKVLAGKVVLVEPDLDPDTRTVKAWVQVRNAEGTLKPNMFAWVAVVLGHREDALAIPSGSVLEADGERFVFVKEGDEFHRVVVTLGADDDAYSEVVDGLVPGDEVVTQGLREVYTLWLTGGVLQQEDD